MFSFLQGIKAEVEQLISEYVHFYDTLFFFVSVNLEIVHLCG